MLEREGAQAIAVTNPHEAWRYRLTDGPSQVVVVGYTRGKVVVNNGQAPAHDTATALLRTVVDGLGGLQGAAASPSAATIAEDHVAHIGTDEAGKGDYFGPLVCAACYIDAEVAVVLRSLGVRDSKTLSDKTIKRLAGEIRSQLCGSFSVVTIQPKRYNSLYEELRREGKNLNALVAWGHARGIKDLVVEHKIDANYVVIDKFADERYMRDRLASDTRTKELRLDQRIKAESDIAVAAASILARDAFVTWLEDRSTQLGMPLPKGAGDPVIAAARRIVAKGGQAALGEVAKLAFKTTQRVLESMP
jgi:ribonuclease HIII